MKKFLLAAALSFGTATASLAAGPADPGIKNTIQSQIDAFLADDFEAAFSYAAPNIKGIFGDHTRFGQMVRSGYPMVWRPEDVRFLELRMDGGVHYQKVMVKDQQGTLYILDYQMFDSPSGWQISAVQILRAPEVGA